MSRERDVSVPHHAACDSRKSHSGVELLCYFLSYKKVEHQSNKAK